MEIMRLRHVANVMNSNVDKVIDPTEFPVRLCNYVHVYKNDFITNDMEFDSGSATEAEIKRFGLRVGDVIITKDSEDRHDIGVPAYVRDTAEDLVCGYHLTILRALKKNCRGDFLFWALQSKGALLHKLSADRTSPFPGQTYAVTSVMGVPSAVKPFRTTTRTWNSAT